MLLTESFKSGFYFMGGAAAMILLLFFLLWVVVLLAETISNAYKDFKQSLKNKTKVKPTIIIK